VRGLDSTLGFTRNLYNPSKESSVIVQSLESLGAIPFCITNVPQSCASFGSGNPVFGTTLNPLNKKLGPGGSSSGTGCLIAAGGAPFGTGSDTGGSLRNPAHFCGISTLKATANRVSRRGCQKCVQNCKNSESIFVGFRIE
jgi:Asp-tRNA(Asn)/Glu-tRNA(Gln) amidotransferase A subunit family amidase